MYQNTIINIGSPEETNMQGFSPITDILLPFLVTDAITPPKYHSLHVIIHIFPKDFERNIFPGEKEGAYLSIEWLMKDSKDHVVTRSICYIDHVDSNFRAFKNEDGWEEISSGFHGVVAKKCFSYLEKRILMEPAST